MRGPAIDSLSRRWRAALRFLAAIAAAAWIVSAVVYVVRAEYPFGFYYDLGVNIAMTSMIAQSAPHLPDVGSLASWQPWFDDPAFMYTPMLNYAASWAIDRVIGDAAKTVKLIQVWQLTLAFVSMAWCYRTLFGATRWRWAAALLYAVAPNTAMLIRADNDFGWIVALLPAALAASVALLRRFGSISLPVCGLLCSLVTGLFAVEYELFAGIPLFFFVCAYAGAFRSRRALYWAILGAVPLLLVTSYVALPTIFGSHVFGWPPSRERELHYGAIAALFSQTPAAATGWILRELIITQPLEEFDASGSLRLILPAGIAIWALALTAAAKERHRLGVRAAIVLTSALLILAAGPGLPVIGNAIWALIRGVPVLNALRTPDRFVVLPAMIAVVAAVRGVDLLHVNRNRAVRVASLCATVLAIAGYAISDAREHVLGLQDTAQREPSLGIVNRAVLARGGRTVSYAFVRDGSVLLTPIYGVPAATVAAAWDLAGAYADGDFGIALLRRSAVRTLVTSPTWVYDRLAGMPDDFGAVVARSPLVSEVFHSAEGIRVFAMRSPREMLHEATTACVDAAPQTFESIAAAKEFDGIALVQGRHAGCASTIYGDYDPRDASVPQAAVARWSGTQAFGRDQLPPPSHAFELGRFFLTTPWYRNSMLGQTLLSGDPFVSAGDHATSSLLRFSLKTPATYSLYLRMLGIGSVSAIDGTRRAGSARNSADLGFTWLAIPLGRLAVGSHAYTLRIDREGMRRGVYAVDAIYVAPDRPPNGNASTIVVDENGFMPETMVATRSATSAAAARPTTYLPGSESWTVAAAYPVSARNMFGLRVLRTSGSSGENVLVPSSGRVARMQVHPTVSGGPATAVIRPANSGAGAARLACGGAAVARRIVGSPLSLSVSSPQQSCVLIVDYNSPSFGIESLTITASGTHYDRWTAQRFFSAGRYRWRCSGGGIDRLTIDGRGFAQNATLELRAGYHSIGLTGKASFGLLEFQQIAHAIPPPRAGSPVETLGPIAWETRLAAAGTLELAEVDDGNWYARAGHHDYGGYSCDLINTCFDVTSAGVALVTRRLPAPTELGLALSAAAVIGAVLPLPLAAFRSRSRRKVRTPTAGGPLERS